MTPKQIAQRLGEQIEAVCRELLPEGKRDGQEWRCGSTGGETGKSLGVHLSGDKAGIWSDFSTGEAGDALDLWCAVRGIPLAQALSEARGFLGIADIRFHEVSKPKVYAKPKIPEKRTDQCQAMDWIRARGITDDTLKAFSIKGNGTQIYFPFIVDGKTLAVKFRDTTDKSKAGFTSKDQQKVLFGWQALDPQAREVVIVEGEIDCLTMAEYGIPALSVPLGAGTGAKHQWIESEYDRLDRFDTIYVCMDNDEPGKAAAKDIIERLGRHRCRYMLLPCNDPNECLKQGVPPGVIRTAMKMAVSMDPQELRSASFFNEEIKFEIYPELRPEQEHTITLPGGFHKDQIVFRPEELILVNGINGHGKSQFLGHITVDALRQNAKICVASLELRPGRLLGRMTRQAAGMEKPTLEYIDAITQWYDDKLWIFDVVGSAKTDRILEVFTYAFRRYGIKVFVIDSLMKCGIADDDYKGQKAFIDKLCDFKHETGSTLFLVTHSKKTESEHKSPGKFDVLGASAITNLADTGISVWRNKMKESQADEGEDDSPDCMVECWKQRNGSGWEGKMPYWFDGGSLQYRPGSGSKPFQYVQFSKLRAVQ